jgi:hypothetical protein
MKWILRLRQLRGSECKYLNDNGLSLEQFDTNTLGTLAEIHIEGVRVVI